MPSFSPPTDPFVVWSQPWGTGIFAHLRPGERGRNVYKLVDGTFTENQPTSWDEVEITYYGGHIYELSPQEESDLVAAGYGSFITQ